MKEESTTNEDKDKKKKDFKIIVTYAENGKSFQSIAEDILIRKINEI